MAGSRYGLGLRALGLPGPSIVIVYFLLCHPVIPPMQLSQEILVLQYSSIVLALSAETDYLEHVAFLLRGSYEILATLQRHPIKPVCTPYIPC